MSDSDEGQLYTLGPDDCISSIAGQFGFFWSTLWFHPKNAALRALRKDPNVLLEGDEIYIPTLQRRTESRPTDNQHRFKRKGIPTLFRLRIVKAQEPRRNEKYTLTIDGAVLEGTTDGDGKLEVHIPPGIETGDLVVGQGENLQRFNLDFGRMKPVTEPAGAIQRLENLGYDCGLNKEKGLAQGLRSFQADLGLPVTGELDAATKTKLLEQHGC